MRDKLGKNNQQWIFDYIIRTTGKAAHWELDAGADKFPEEVRSWDMLPKFLGKRAARQEEFGRRAEEAGHFDTAWSLYYIACNDYFNAQHIICEFGHPDKVRMYERLLACHEKVRKYNKYPIEKVEIPWGNNSIAGLLHLVPDRKKAPCIIYIPGMDSCKEVFANPRPGVPIPVNSFLNRGMHVLSIDGPGQGESYMRQIWVRPDNHAEAASAAVDYLLTRPEVDGDKIGIYGVSMGSYWTAHIAAHDSRLKTASTTMGCFMVNRHPIFEEASPRFRLTYKFMAGIEDDDEFDEKIVSKMTVKGIGAKIKNPFLIQIGEFDPLNPIEEADAFFNEIAGPKEMWVMEDDFHNEFARGFCHLATANLHADWHKDKLDDKYPPDLARRVLIPLKGFGPYPT